MAVVVFDSPWPFRYYCFYQGGRSCANCQKPIAVNNKKAQSKPSLFRALGIAVDNSDKRSELCQDCVSVANKQASAERAQNVEDRGKVRAATIFVVVMMHYQCSCTTSFAALLCQVLQQTWNARPDIGRRAGCCQCWCRIQRQVQRVYFVPHPSGANSGSAASSRGACAGGCSRREKGGSRRCGRKFA